MITKQSNGSDITADFISAVQSDNRNFIAGLYINGTELSCSIVNLTITKGSCASQEQFAFGDVISSTLSAELKGLTENVKGEEIEVRIGLDTGSGYEYITLGFFTATLIKKTVYTTTITAYGRTVSKTAGAFYAPATLSISNIASEIATECGCSVTLDNDIDGSKTLTKSMIGFTTYGALQLLAKLVGGYAVDTYDGNIAIHRYKDTPTLEVDTGMMLALPDAEEEDFEVTGFEIIVKPDAENGEGAEVTGESYSAGLPVVIQQTNEYMTLAIFNDIDIIGYTYRPANITLSLGDPRIEGNDVLQVTDINGNVYVVPCHVVTHTYDGGFHSLIASTNPTPQSDDIGTLPPISTMIANASTSAQTAQNTADDALNGVLNGLTLETPYTLANGYATFTAVVYQGGKPLDFPDSEFAWYRKTEDYENYPSGKIPIGTGRTLVVASDSMVYGGVIRCEFTHVQDAYLMNSDGNILITSADRKLIARV
jgi:hypothetical protein